MKSSSVPAVNTLFDDELERALDRACKIIAQREWRRAVKENTVFSAFEVGRLADISVDWISAETSLRLLDELITDFNTEFFPVKDKGEFVGYVKAEKFRALLGQNQYTRHIFLRPENKVTEVLEKGLVVVDARTPLSDVSRLLMSRPRDQLYDPFVITYRGEYYGVATVKAVMDGIAFYELKDTAAAREAQQAMLALEQSNSDLLFDHAYHYEPHGEVGGDFLYLQGLQPHLGLFAIMDVCGKGIKAAQMVLALGAYFRAVFRYLTHTHRELDYKSLQLSARLRLLNRMLVQSTPTDMYASGAVLLLDSKNNALVYFDFGHTPVYVLRQGKVHVLPRAAHNAADGFPFFGVDENLVIRSTCIQVKSGDIVLATTDGVSETRNEAREEFGEEGIIRAMSGKNFSHPREAVHHLCDTLREFRGKYRRLDDMSVMAFMVP
ncbi:MAG: SpoIIE family protein phosphatase [Leptospiraceae bacterium]|nr:SpoIIE family protein phosphatase [Leptospiraceae bacterium]